MVDNYLATLKTTKCGKILKLKLSVTDAAKNKLYEHYHKSVPTIKCSKHTMNNLQQNLYEQNVTIFITISKKYTFSMTVLKQVLTN